MEDILEGKKIFISGVIGNLLLTR